MFSDWQMCSLRLRFPNWKYIILIAHRMSHSINCMRSIFKKHAIIKRWSDGISALLDAIKIPSQNKNKIQMQSRTTNVIVVIIVSFSYAKQLNSCVVFIQMEAHSIILYAQLPNEKWQTKRFKCCGKEMNELCHIMAHIVHASHLANTINTSQSARLTGEWNKYPLWSMQNRKKNAKTNSRCHHKHRYARVQWNKAICG